MFGKAKAPQTSHQFDARERTNPFFPELALRRRSSDHPMMMFAVLAGACLASMALIPTAGPAMASAKPSISVSAPLKISDVARSTEKSARLQPESKSANPCAGQNWGNEDLDCLLMIARQSGKPEKHAIRMIASAEPDGQRPNIY